MSIPLAERIRPRQLSDYIGQEHLVGPKGALSSGIQNGTLPSVIFWGTPGIGKTTLANIIAKETQRPFYTLSAISSGVKEVREVIQKAQQSNGLFENKTPILFIDEIHRFSKSQQDSLLGAVEKGWITLIGATTENPSFEVISALLSRCQVYVLNPFGKKELQQLLDRAVKEDTVLKEKDIVVKETDALFKFSGGDARKLLNIFELLIASFTEKKITITNQLVQEKILQNPALYDKGGDQHYDIISAFIKSIRGSDPNAAVYWLARMLEGGEDIKFIARRMVILASEDIGNANPTALVIATNTFQSVSIIGMPESRIILSQCAIYLATSPKSNSSYLAIEKARKLVHETGDLSVPLALRNAPTTLMKELDYGKEYQYAHDFEGNFVKQEFLPKELENSKIYSPGQNTRETAILEFLKKSWKDKYGY
ncbi:MAG: replication-associated recombination protein A [Flavobacteriaceae bacterium]|nr:replication-associated recombination protein A [Flavobacteriaceae bacterium]